MQIPAAKKGENAKGYAMRVLASHIVANERLTNDAAFYAGVQKSFGGPR